MPKTKFQSIIFTLMMVFCLIVPTITLFATFVHNGVSNWFCNWIQLAALCFPVALCLQIFFVGPLVRFVFRKIFVQP